MISIPQFALILEEGYRAGAPRNAKSAILREYLQCEVLSILTQIPGSQQLAFIGGTGLRLLYNLDRFSEDLDFDYFGRAPSAPLELFRQTTTTLLQRGYVVDFRSKPTKADRGGTLVFQHLPFELGLSPHKNETLAIKLDYTTPEVASPTESRVLNRFGFVAQVVTESLSILCARKAAALLARKRTQPRDIYDLVWFFSRRVIPDTATFQRFAPQGAGDPIVEIITKLEGISSDVMRQYQRDLQPFLLESGNANVITSLLPMAKQLRVAT